MEYCKYHPLEGATHKCNHCNSCQCDKCVDDTDQNGNARCFVCGNLLVSLGAANTVEPFWRRLPEAFRYPVNGASMSIIIGMAIVSVIAIVMPFLLYVSLMMYLFSVGSMLKYSFTCLERTALGEMTAPDVMDAYQGGIKLLLKLLLVTAILGAVVVACIYYIGQGFGGFIFAVVAISYPAVLIRFAQTENMWEALNPLGALSLILAIGLPYGVLIAFILIMMSSVGILHEIIGRAFPAISYVLQAIVSNYYTVVLFHIMGYMLFQFQSRLGYTAREEDNEAVRSETERLQAKIDVLLKEGRYEQVVNLFHHAFKQYPNEAVFFEKYFDFLYACKKADFMADYGTDYLHFLIRRKRFDKITIAYKQIVHIAPEFSPAKPDVRVQVAKLLKQQGDVKLAIKMLNGMHKLYPDYAGLGDAYEALAQAFDDLPGMQAQAEKCREWVAQFNRKMEAEQVRREEELKRIEAERIAQAVRPTGVKQKRSPDAHSKPAFSLELVPIDKKEDAPSES